MSYKNWKILQACLKFKGSLFLWSLWILTGVVILGYHSWARVPKVFFPEIPYLGWTASLLNDLALYSMVGIFSLLLFVFWDDRPRKEEKSNAASKNDLELNFTKELGALGIFFLSYSCLSWNVELLSHAWIGIHAAALVFMFIINLIMVLMVIGATGITSYALWDQILEECKPKGVALEAEDEKKYLEQSLLNGCDGKNATPEKKVKRL